MAIFWSLILRSQPGLGLTESVVMREPKFSLIVLDLQELLYPNMSLRKTVAIMLFIFQY